MKERRLKETSTALRWLPGLAVLWGYDPRWLANDILAGVVLTSMLVPVGIGYAVASGVPGALGLYATIASLLAYALFGPSRILVVGPDSSLAAIIFGGVVTIGAGDPERTAALAGLMALVSGAVCVLAGLAKLGFVTELLSKPIRYGYMNGIALTVLASQLPKLFGIKLDSEGPIRDLGSLALAILAGGTNGTALAIGAGALAAILILKRHRRVPGILIVVATATVAVALFDLSERAGVSVMGPLPEGLPHLALPRVAPADLLPAVVGGFAVALVAFADTSVLSRAYAARLKQRVDPNQEMIGLGVANLAAGLFQGIPISSSSSRTPVAEAAGGRTQLTGVVGAAAVALLLVAFPRLLEDLPTAALAAVVIASAVGLIEFRDLARIFRIQQWEFWLSIACFAGVVAFGAIPGIGIAIVLAVIEFLWDAWRPYSAVLGKVEDLRGYHDVTRHPDARQIPGLVLFRWDAPLFFANGEFFREQASAAVAEAPAPAQWLVVAAEPVTSVDVTSADALMELKDALAEAGTELRFAEVKDPVKDKLRRFGIFDALGGEPAFFPTIGAAVDAFAKQRPDPTA